MTLLEASVLGLIQGLTEFLPISSTAHLRVVPALLDWPDRGAAFTAVIQLGTLIAVFFYFWSDVVRLARGLRQDLLAFQIGSNVDSQLAWKIIVGTVPVVICGLLLKKQIEGEFRNLQTIAYSLIGFSILLAFSEIRAKRKIQQRIPPREEGQITWGDVLMIGCFQALALIPGASRSGVTITAGLFVGLSRSTSARFSFLLSLPALLGAALYEMVSKRAELFSSSEQVLPLIVATAVAGVVGYASIAFLLGYLRKYTTYLFVVYRILLGITLLILLQQGVL